MACRVIVVVNFYHASWTCWRCFQNVCRVSLETQLLIWIYFHFNFLFVLCICYHWVLFKNQHPESQQTDKRKCSLTYISLDASVFSRRTDAGQPILLQVTSLTDNDATDGTTADPTHNGSKSVGGDSGLSEVPPLDNATAKLLCTMFLFCGL